MRSHSLQKGKKWYGIHVLKIIYGIYIYSKYPAHMQEYCVENYNFYTI
jgi:hypothetical protein